jgi:hypothetical protein
MNNGDHAYIEHCSQHVTMRLAGATAAWPCGENAADLALRNNPEGAIQQALNWAFDLGAVTAEVHRPDQSPQEVRLADHFSCEVSP